MPLRLHSSYSQLRYVTDAQRAHLTAQILQSITEKLLFLIILFLCNCIFFFLTELDPPLSPGEMSRASVRGRDVTD